MNGFSSFRNKYIIEVQARHTRKRWLNECCILKEKMKDKMRDVEKKILVDDRGTSSLLVQVGSSPDMLSIPLGGFVSTDSNLKTVLHFP